MKKRSYRHSMALYYKYVRPLIKTLYYSLFSFFLNAVSYLLFWIRPKTINTEQIYKILLVKLERIGDLVLTTPAIQAVRRHFPHSSISMIVNSYSREIIEHNAHLDEVIVFDGLKTHKTLKEKVHFIKNLRNKKIDLAIDLDMRDFHLLPVLLLYLSGAKVTLGLNNSGRGFLFNIKVKQYPQPRPLAEEIMHILHPLDIKSSVIQPKLFLSHEDIIYITKYFKGMDIKENDLLVGIHPGGYFQTLRWVKEGYAEVAEHLIKKYRAKVFLVGGPQEKDLVDEIIALTVDKVINLAGKISLGQLMAFISKCQLFIGGSSGPLNIAIGFDIPTISFLGPSIPARWWPQGEKHIVFRKDLPCSPCESGYCWEKNFSCMTKITPQEVIKAADLQVQRLSRP